MKRLVVLGSTGSIGRQTLDIVRAFPDRFEVVGLAGGRNVELLRQQVAEFRPRYVWCSAGFGASFSAAAPKRPARWKCCRWTKWRRWTKSTR